MSRTVASVSSAAARLRQGGSEARDLGLAAQQLGAQERDCFPGVQAGLGRLRREPPVLR